MFFVCLWPTGRILVGAIGGFSLSMFALSTKTDGLFTNQIARYSWIGAFTITFAALAGLKNYYQYVAIISTVATGCYCLLLGTDIFVRAAINIENHLYLFPRNKLAVPEDNKTIPGGDNSSPFLSLPVSCGIVVVDIPCVFTEGIVNESNQQSIPEQTQYQTYSTETTSRNPGVITCENDAKAFTKCLEQNNHDTSLCQWYLENLINCQQMASKY
ncbi:1281_t:CDS:2 [Entrophospora sp. SA101]|nr:1281_t:CDS:2 [Entrophospora sp. SA101]